MDIIQGCWKSISFDWRITCGVYVISHFQQSKVGRSKTILSFAATTSFLLSVTFSKNSFGKTTFRFAATTSFLLLFVFYFLVLPVNCSIFWHHDKNNLTRKILSRAKTCQGNMLFASLCHQARWWRPGRVETSRRCGEQWVLYALVCLELSRLFGLRSLTPPSPFALNIPWKGWCWACACSSKLILPIFIQ